MLNLCSRDTRNAITGLPVLRPRPKRGLNQNRENHILRDIPGTGTGSVKEANQKVIVFHKLRGDIQTVHARINCTINNHLQLLSTMEYFESLLDYQSKIVCTLAVFFTLGG